MPIPNIENVTKIVLAYYLLFLKIKIGQIYIYLYLIYEIYHIYCYYLIIKSEEKLL